MLCPLLGGMMAGWPETLARMLPNETPTNHHPITQNTAISK